MNIYKILVLLPLLSLLIPSKGQSASYCKKVYFPVEKLKCSYQKTKIDGLLGEREVLFALPKGQAPRDGFPVVIIFQGSFFKVGFERSKGLPFGAYNEVKLIKNLLDHGFAVIAPRAFTKVAWQTNIIGINYNLSGDKIFINRLLDAIEVGDFGEIDFNNLFATGISSGGYMTDRMAQSHGDRPWKALAISSASYATCGGPLCILPKKIHKNHPPTLFMHGKKDLVVPVRTMKKYADLLEENGVYVKKVIDQKATHQWIDSTGKEVVLFFTKFLSEK